MCTRIGRRSIGRRRWAIAAGGRTSRLRRMRGRRLRDRRSYDVDPGMRQCLLVNGAGRAPRTGSGRAAVGGLDVERQLALKLEGAGFAPPFALAVAAGGLAATVADVDLEDRLAPVDATIAVLAEVPMNGSGVGDDVHHRRRCCGRSAIGSSAAFLSSQASTSAQRYRIRLPTLMPFGPVPWARQ